jgi:hypothetical protein
MRILNVIASRSRGPALVALPLPHDPPEGIDEVRPAATETIPRLLCGKPGFIHRKERLVSPLLKGDDKISIKARRARPHTRHSEDQAMGAVDLGED